MASSPKKAPAVPAGVPTPPVDPSSVRTVTLGGLELRIGTGAALPPDIGQRAARPDRLPLAEGVFANMKPGDNFYLPTAFWEARQAKLPPTVKKAVINSTYIRNKVLGAFSAWKKEAPAAREKLYMRLYECKRGLTEDVGLGYTDPRPGFVLYLLEEQPKTAAE